MVGICGILNVQDSNYRMNLGASKKRFLLKGERSMFRGVSEVHIDTKGRIVMPTRYRECFTAKRQGGIVVTIDTEERCLLLYPIAVWETIEHQLIQLPSFHPAARRIQRLLIGHASDSELDNHGRLLLPGLLREYAGLEKSAVLVGQGKKLECWNEETWEQRRAEWLEEEESADHVALPDEVKLLVL